VTCAAQKASVAAHAAARSYEHPALIAVARSIAQAVATAHFADHSLVAATYALKAVKATGGLVKDETAWQNGELGDDIRHLVKPGHDGPKAKNKTSGRNAMGLLDGKVAIITGAGGGLGEAYAKLFAREGASVVVNDLGGPRDGSGADLSMAEQVVDAITKAGGKAIANGADISTIAGGQSVFDDAIKAFGKVDILVNNAGILRDQSFSKSTEEAWDKVIKVHLKGTYCVTRPVFNFMRDHGGGVIVNTSSTSGLIGNFGQSNYGAAKGGIWGFSNVLAIEGRKYGIRIWTLSPGALTRMTADLPRYIENPGAALDADGIAPAVLYMVSDLSGDQTGKVLGVSGPRGVREMKMMEMDGWKPPLDKPWDAQDIVTHAAEIFFSDEEAKQGARRF
jgi:NAD(P)-dependent dehydrogenase (short-subunit alcohol dehydrogenase family)